MRSRSNFFGPLFLEFLDSPLAGTLRQSGFEVVKLCRCENVFKKRKKKGTELYLSV